MSEYPNCKETLDKLQPYLDRELTDEEVAVVRFHMDRCPPCQHVMHFEERLRRLVRIKACTDSAPATLREQILARLKPRSAPGA